jgi:DNA-binding MarR family transcriptional regulator
MNVGMPTDSDPQRTAQIAALAQDCRRIVGKLKRRLREQADVGDLTPSQTSVLLRLEKDGPATTSSLARLEGMRPQSMGAILTALGNAGLVTGEPHPTDGRQTLLSLTPACRSWIGEGRAARQDWLTRTIQTRLAASEQDQLIAAMTLLERLVDD